MNKEYKFKVAELESQLPQLLKDGVTEISVYDTTVSGDKKKILSLFKLIAQKAPDLFISILIEPSVIDKEIASAASQLFCSFDIPLAPLLKGDKLLFDKKYLAGKARILNDYGLVFGFELDYGMQKSDSLKQFLDRLDFAVNQYPNHIEFDYSADPQVTGLFSAKDLRYARDVAFACECFYTAGRAVPWMLSVLKPLRIYPSKFFSDFAEWQRCNNCDYKSGFSFEKEPHIAIEKMQLLFLEEKFEEKNCSELFPAVRDAVKLNGAMSRLCGEKEEAVIQTSYSPDDIFSEEIMDIASFCENVCMMECKVKLFAAEDGPDYEIL